MERIPKGNIVHHPLNKIHPSEIQNALQERKIGYADIVLRKDTLAEFIKGSIARQ